MQFTTCSAPSSRPRSWTFTTQSRTQRTQMRKTVSSSGNLPLSRTCHRIPRPTWSSKFRSQSPTLPPKTSTWASGGQLSTYSAVSISLIEVYSDCLCSTAQQRQTSTLATWLLCNASPKLWSFSGWGLPMIPYPSSNLVLSPRQRTMKCHAFMDFNLTSLSMQDLSTLLRHPQRQFSLIQHMTAKE